MSAKVKKSKLAGSDIFLDHFSFLKKEWVIGIVLLSTVAVFFPSLQNDFVRWDDQSYVTENNVVRDLAGGNFLDLGTNVAGNFHPLTMMSLKMDYRMGKLDPFIYHFKNVVFHVFNTFLVFLVLMSLTKGNFFVSIFTSLIFGIHPMHVESVTWISERKDVLYTFHFLISFLCYLRYKRDKKLLFYYLSLGFFLLSCLSKSAAVILPMVLLLTDIFKSEKMNLRNLSEKIPYFMFSLLFGIIALYTQSQSGAIDIEKNGFVDSILYSSMGFFTYMVKFFYPYRLTHFHPYPEINTVIYALVLVSNLAALFWVILKRRQYPWLFWGYFFFLLTIVLVLQFLKVGNAFISDRYTYVPYVGLAFVVAKVLEKLIRDYEKWAPVLWFMMLGFCIFLGYKTFVQTKVWTNTVTLWNHYNETYPTFQSRGYLNLGEFYAFSGDSIQAFNFVQTAIEKDPKNFRAYEVLGNFYFAQNKFEESEAVINRAIAINPEYVKVYKPRSLIYYNKGRLDEALEDINYFLDHSKQDHDAYHLRGRIHMQRGDMELARQDIDKALELNPDYEQAISSKQLLMSQSSSNLMRSDQNAMDLTGVQALLNRGINRYNNRDLQGALSDFSQVLVLEKDNQEAFKRRGAVYRDLQLFDQALADLNAFLQNNPDDVEALRLRIGTNMGMNRFEATLPDFEVLIENYPNAGTYYNGRGMAYYKLGEVEQALSDLNEAVRLGERVNPALIESLQNQL